MFPFVSLYSLPINCYLLIPGVNQSSKEQMHGD